MNIKNIVFATDFSDNSVLAFKSAKSLAEEHNAKLLILYVQKDTEETRFLHSLTSLTDTDHEAVVEKSIEDHFTHYLEKNAGEFKNYETIVKHGKPFQEILKFSEERSADLIVAGSHGRTGIEHVIFGSTSERIVRKSKIPVLIIPGKH